MNRHDMEAVLEALVRIQEEGPPITSCGICYNVNYLCRQSRGRSADVPKELFVEWPSYSGDIENPIPGIGLGGRLVPELAAKTYSECYGEQWDRDTLYGRLRWDLLKYLIDRMRFLLGEEGATVEQGN